MGGIDQMFVQLVGHDPVFQGLVGGIVIAGLNLVGASLVLVYRNPSERFLDGALGFAAGVMLAASFTSLILPGIEFASTPEYGAIGIGGFDVAGPYPVVIGLGLGVLLIVPHAHYLLTGQRRTDTAEQPDNLSVADDRLGAVILFILAITLHNMPEGLAVGIGFGAGDVSGAIVLMLAIGIQNIPEGLAVSIAAINAGLDSRVYAAIAGVRAGVVEIPLAVLGAYAVQVAEPILPYAMGFAAGAMLFVISDEIVPETHLHGHERIATMGTMIGVIVMLYLDVMLG